MRFNRHIILAVLAIVALCGVTVWATAQVPLVGTGSCNLAFPSNTVVLVDPSSGNCTVETGTPGAPSVISDNFEGTKATYSAAVTSFAPVATPTDIMAVCGSSTKTVRVLRWDISGIATTAGTIDVLLIKRAAADTGSTPVAMTLVPNDSSDSAATATANTFTVSNPTINSTVGTVRNIKQPLALAGSVGNPQQWTFGANLDKTVILRGTAQCLAMNLNGGTLPAGTSLDIDVEWSEE